MLEEEGSGAAVTLYKMLIFCLHFWHTNGISLVISMVPLAGVVSTTGEAPFVSIFLFGKKFFQKITKVESFYGTSYRSFYGAS